MSPEPRANDRPTYYTMKTPALVAAASPQGLTHSSSSPPCYFSVKQKASPVPSPRSSPSLGQPRPPKLSPRGPRGGAANARPSSPNYFGLAVDPALESRDSCLTARDKTISAFSLNLPVPPQPGRERTSPPRLPSSGNAGAPTATADSRQSSPEMTSATMASPSPSRPVPVGPSVGSQAPGSDLPAMITPDELRDLLEGDHGGNILLLDLRISPQFAQSRVRGALNLCIPTTLLKRATFNLQKLQQTFQRNEDEQRFSNWRDASHLVVYDSSSSERRDAVSAMNMIKKFTNEGYSGSACILRGGFNSFAMAHPDLIDRSTGESSPGLSLSSGAASGGPRANLPPIIGGVMLPNSTVGPTPFFANIRQNQDLIDGVGQMDVGMPAGLSPNSLPRWLQEAADAGDHGKRVSDKFLNIERAEQSRMRDAYSLLGSDQVHNKTNVEGTPKVQLSGLEMGAKNRYKDILPFEHARVKLLGRPEGACDYVNASHLQAKRTHKRYIASQGPLPTTFEDFWTMVWDNDVRVIVMLTAESEGGQTKCHAYWEGSDFGPIRLRLVSEKKVSLDIDKRRSTHPTSHDASVADAGRRRANTMATPESGPQARQLHANSQTTTTSSETPFVVVRKFAVSHVAYPFMPMREVTQLHYQSWPDFGTPAQPSHLLALVELANVMQRAALPVDMAGPAASLVSSRTSSDSAMANLFSPNATSGRNSAASARPREDSYSLPLLSWQEPVTPEHDRPMLVHCSAGCGRTGAFCTVDSVIDMLKRQRQHMLRQRSRGAGTQTQHGAQPPDPDPDGDVSMAEGDAAVCNDRDANSRPGASAEGDSTIDTSWLDDDSIDLIAQTVEDFRGQRLSMVQSLRQFVLCYETILEWMRRLQGDSGGGEHEANGRARSGTVRF
ncbi:hypothetical protein VTJ49DRAFT_3512 [Mycothermus thermophilus]|uniref:protein-tyrosine-phosphatase n=1 Tax=Humicola insolens TaxID=85995 RepID=A0ABR3V8B2_HUMIN